MAAKRAAIPLPELHGKRVLDVGTDMGYWAFLAADQGATRVLGLDRNRKVRGLGHVDLVSLNRATANVKGRDNCEFAEIDIGRQYRIFGHFDVVLCFSVYHHIFEAAGGDHQPVWFWLWHHARLSAAVLLWEGPVDLTDPVVKVNVSAQYQPTYTRNAILAAAAQYFVAEFIGPALHEPTREVWRFRPRPTIWSHEFSGTIQSGAGGATKAFEYVAGRRMLEIERALGWRPIPGSLNISLDRDFDWDIGYFRAQILDVKDRSAGLDSEWVPRWARFYPVTIDGEDACAFRFEGEHYPRSMVELIAPWKLREMISRPRVTLWR